MKYYSEVLGSVFATEDELLAAEKEHNDAIAKAEAKKKELSDARKARAAEVEEARKASQAANEKYLTLLKEFCKDYNSYHYSLKENEIPSAFSSLWDFFRF